jgi:hypothetical protein
MTIDMLFNTILSFQTMSTRMAFSGLLMFSNIDMCFTDNALEEWQLVTPHQDDQTIEKFQYFQEEWLTSLLPDNAFVSQKEGMTNIMQKPYSIKVKDFGNLIKKLNCFFALMPHEDQDSVFTDTDLKALLLKPIPLSWQNTYLLKGTSVSDNFCQMLSYFVQFQSIGDSQVAFKPFLSPATIHGGGGRFSCGHSGHGQLGHSTSSHFNGNQSFHIPRTSNIGTCGVYLDYSGTCPVHLTLTHTWDDCFNNPKHSFTGSWNVRNQERGGQTGCGLYYCNP